MRDSVASTGKGAGSVSPGSAARRNAVYSVTGSTTHPSAAGPVLCARVAAVVIERNSRSGARLRIGFIVVLLAKRRGSDLKIACQQLDVLRPGRGPGRHGPGEIGRRNLMRSLLMTETE